MGSRGMGVCWLPKARRDVRVSDTGRHVLGRRFISGIHVKAYAALRWWDSSAASRSCSKTWSRRVALSRARAAAARWSADGNSSRTFLEYHSHHPMPLAPHAALKASRNFDGVLSGLDGRRWGSMGGGDGLLPMVLTGLIT
jgi:hypothetical protein